MNSLQRPVTSRQSRGGLWLEMQMSLNGSRKHLLRIRRVVGNDRKHTPKKRLNSCLMTFE